MAFFTLCTYYCAGDPTLCLFSYIHASGGGVSKARYGSAGMVVMGPMQGTVDLNIIRLGITQGFINPPNAEATFIQITRT